MVAYEAVDVSLDRTALDEMMAKSGQRGVPVIAVDDEIIVGFDRERLESILTGGRSA